MGTAQPIKNEEALREFTDYYRLTRPSARNYALIIFSLNTALRISDLLALKWENIYDFESEKMTKHLCIREHKTGKISVIALNSRIHAAVYFYMEERCPAKGEFLFSRNTSHTEPLCRTQAYRIIRKAAAETLHLPNISCHSMRKTFGYHAWKQGTPPALLMDIYNHSTYAHTKRYLGIDQDERDSVFLEVML